MFLFTLVLLGDLFPHDPLLEEEESWKDELAMVPRFYSHRYDPTGLMKFRLSLPKTKKRRTNIHQGKRL